MPNIQDGGRSVRKFTEIYICFKKNHYAYEVFLQILKYSTLYRTVWILRETPKTRFNIVWKRDKN